MKADSRIFGKIEIEDDKIITLEKGMIGFPDLNHFAPKDVPVYRKEVYLQIQKENQEAISLDGIEALKGILG